MKVVLLVDARLKGNVYLLVISCSEGKLERAPPPCLLGVVNCKLLKLIYISKPAGRFSKGQQGPSAWVNVYKAVNFSVVKDLSIPIPFWDSGHTFSIEDKPGFDKKKGFDTTIVP